MSFEQNDKTKSFIREVKNLIDQGIVKNYSEIVNELDWDKTLMSNIMNGRKNVPNDIYRKFKEVYRPVEVSNSGTLTIEHLIRIEAMNSVILGALAEVLAFQRSQPVTKVNNDLVSTVQSQIKQMLDRLK